MKNRNKGIALSYVNTIINLICGLFLSSFLLRSLGDTEYGIYQTISSFANYLVLLEFGTGTVMTRNISICLGKKQGKDEIDKNTSTIWTITNILALVIICVSVLFYCLMGNIYSQTLSADQLDYARSIFVFITVYLVVSFYVQTLNGIVLAFEQYSYAPIQNIARTVIRTAALIVLITCYKYSVLIAVIDMFLSILILAFSLFYCIKKYRISLSFKKFDFIILKSVMPLCIAICLQAIVNQANNNVDKFVIGIMVSPEAVTLYSISLYIFSIFSSLTTTPISMYAPQLAKDISKGISRDDLTKKLIAPCRMIAIIGGTVLFGFIAAGKQFIAIMYGSEYNLAWIIAIIIMAPMFINMTNGVLVNVLDVLNKRIVRSVILIITTTANIILTVFFIGIWGIVGAAAATAICTVIGQVIIMNIYYSRKIKIKVMYMFFYAYKGILPFQFLGAVCSIIAGSFISNIYISFVVCGLIYVLVFLAGYLFFGANESEKLKLKSILYRGKKK